MTAKTMQPQLQLQQKHATTAKLQQWQNYTRVLSLQFARILRGQHRWHPKQTAGPSTAPLAVKLREASLRMTISDDSFG
jgi:hypothetical protein